MMKILVSGTIYICVNIVAGTFVGVPIDEKILGVKNLFEDVAALTVLAVWYSFGTIATFALMFVFRGEEKIHIIIPITMMGLWMLSSLHFRLIGDVDWNQRRTILFFVCAFAEAVVSQAIAVQAAELFWERL